MEVFLYHLPTNMTTYQEIKIIAPAQFLSSITAQKLCLCRDE